MFWRIALVFLILAYSPLFSQWGPGQWVDNEQFLVSLTSNSISPTKFLINSNNDVAKTIPRLQDAKDFPVPNKYLSFVPNIYWHSGAFYAIAYSLDTSNYEMGENGTKLQRITFAKYENEAWHYIGTLRSTPDVVFAIPCDDNKFIVISLQIDLTGNQGRDRSPFCLVSLRHGTQEFRIDRAIDHKIDESMFEPSWFELAASDSTIVLSDEYAVVIHNNTGIYWVFSLKKATLTRSGRIFRKVTNEMISKGGFNRAILQVHPEKDGNVLISAQDV